MPGPPSWEEEEGGTHICASDLHSLHAARATPRPRDRLNEECLAGGLVNEPVPPNSTELNPASLAPPLLWG